MADKAILCGINTYRSINGLQGCLPDVEDIQRLLIDNYNFKESNIRVYRDAQVVKSVIVDGFAWLNADTGPGDRVVFHFSGHGSYTNSASPDKVVDELLCLYDMSWTDENSFLRDTDLGALTREITSGARLTVILDSCHSGTGTKAFTPSFRGEAKGISPKNALVIVADTAQRMVMQGVEKNSAQLARGIERAEPSAISKLNSEDSPPVFARFVEPPAIVQEAIAKSGRVGIRAIGQTARADLNHELLAAADEKQTAADAYIDGKYRGAFSFNLCATARANSSRSFHEVMQLTTQRIKQQGFSQDPQIDGPFAQEAFLGTAGQSVPSTASQNPGPAQTPITGSGVFSEDSLKETTPEREVMPLAILERLLRVSEKLIDLSAKPTPPPRLASRPNKLVSDCPPVRSREVIGNEDRVRVSDVFVQPFCWVCQILSNADGEPRKNTGSGAFIGPRTILTAAHNLYVAGRRARSFEIYLAVNGDRSNPPLGAYVATHAVHHPNYINSPNFSPFDIAVIQLDEPLPANVTDFCGTMPFVPISPGQWVGSIGMVPGYPRDYPRVDRSQ